MDSVKIFKYIITINLAIVVLFVVFLFGNKYYNDVKKISSVEESSLVDLYEKKTIEEQKPFIEENKESIKNNVATNNIRDKNLELQKIIESSNNAGDCQKLGDINFIMGCERSMLLKQVLNNNIENCDKVTDEGLVLECKSIFEYREVLKNINSHECSEIGNEQEKIMCEEKIFPFYEFVSKKYTE